jgi:hypothetical protein
MHLSQIRLGRITRDTRKVLDGRASVRVAVDAPSFDKDNLVDDRLTEAVGAVLAHRDDMSSAFVLCDHRSILAQKAGAQPRGASVRAASASCSVIGVKLAASVVLCIVVLALSGCSTPAASAPTASTSSSPASAPTPATTPDVVDGLPANCKAFFSGLKTFVSPDGSLVLNPAWKSGPGTSRSVASGYGSYDPTLAGMLSTNPGMICDWAPATGPSTTFLTTQLRHVDAATQQAALARLEGLGWGCSSQYGGEWCLTDDSHTGVSIGESQFIGKGVWLASDWNNAGPETYTPRLLMTLFG